AVVGPPKPMLSRREHAWGLGGSAGARPQATAPKTEPPEERGRAREARRGGEQEEKEEEEGRREGEEGPRPLGHSKENGQQPAYRGGQAEKCPLASPVGLAAPAPSSLCCAAAEVGERNMDRERERERGTPTAAASARGGHGQAQKQMGKGAPNATGMSGRRRGTAARSAKREAPCHPPLPPPPARSSGSPC
ncbi:unnamed protein product, partial [Prorocentrum cordatum]